MFLAFFATFLNSLFKFNELDFDGTRKENTQVITTHFVGF
jgi:hypothetical protein